MAAWRLRVLGEVALEGEGGRLALERKTAALLAYLALEGAAPRSKLAGLLWPEVDEARARNNLRQTLHRLRQHVGCDLVIPNDPLRLGELEVDAARFKLLAFQGEHQALLSLSAAILPHFDYDDLPEFADWLYAERERLAGLHAEALEAECERLTSEGEHAAALACAERLIAIDPVSEEAYRRAMRLHHLFGDRAGALKVFERCRAMLKRDLGVAPLPETAELAAEIARGTVLPKAAKSRPVIPLSIQRPPVLAGRTREWQLLEEAWQRGQIVFIAGEAGVGKSRLLQDFLASKGPYGLFYGRPGDASVPYAFHARAWRHVLETFPDLALPPWAGRELSRILPELAQEPLPPMTSEQDKLRLFEAKAELVSLAAARGWQAFAADDLHYCDEASFEAGVYLLNKFVPMPSPDKPRSLYAFRTGELPAHIWERVQQLIDTGLAVLIELEPLDEAGVHELVAGLKLPLDLPVAPLARFTGGNPFFIVQTIKSLWESGQLGTSLGHLPASGRVRSLIAERFARLSAQARRLCWGAAVAGEEFGLEPIAHMLEVTPLELAEPWQELERRQILTGRGFSHDLLYETVLGLIPAPVKNLLHRRCAEYLETRGANPARIARHYMDAGDSTRAAPFLIRAAQAAEAAIRYADAADFYELAGAALEAQGTVLDPPEGDVATAHDAYLGQAEMLLYFDNGPRHRAVVEKLKRLSRSPAEWARAYYAEAEWLRTLGKGPESEQAARHGYAWALKTDRVKLQAKLLNAIAGALYLQGRIREAVSPLQASHELYESLPDPEGVAITQVNLALFLSLLSRYQESVQLYREVLSAQESQGRKDIQAHALVGMAAAQSELGLEFDALDCLNRARALLDGLQGVLHQQINCAYHLGRVRAHLTEYRGALEALALAAELAAGYDVARRGLAQLELALVYLNLGRPDEAATYLALASDQNLSNPDRVRLLLARGQLLWRQGEAASPAFDEAEILATRGEHTLLLGKLWAAKAAVLPPSDGLPLARRALDLALDAGLGGLRIAAETRCAQALLALGEPERALERISSAATLLSDFGRVKALAFRRKLQRVLGRLDRGMD
jgi:DNA-binding SARP family transcriptional activator